MVFERARKLLAQIRDSLCLPALEDESIEPFDFIFIDADKQNNPEYLKGL